MPADPRDDFSPFAANEHMFYGLIDPYAMIRAEILGVLRRQVADTQLHHVAVQGEPKYLTIGRASDEPDKVIVAHFGFCLQATLGVTDGRGEKGELLPATATFLFCDVDQPGKERMQLHLDLFADAGQAFDDDVFRRRFLAFRTASTSQAPAG
jgi:hypothetical protein